MEDLMRIEAFARGSDWAVRSWPAPSDVRALGGGLEIEASRRVISNEDHFQKYKSWFDDILTNVSEDAVESAGFAWRRDDETIDAGVNGGEGGDGGGVLLWCAGLNFEAIMLSRFEACAFLASAWACSDAELALELRASAAAAFDAAARAAETWGSDGNVPQGAWRELTTQHNRDCALLAATVTHATAIFGGGMGKNTVSTESAETIEARCGALAACHASLAAHNDAHDPSAPPCVAIAVACSVLALDTLVSNSERHLKLCDASSAGACAERARELLSVVAVPQACVENLEHRLDTVEYITSRVTRERVPFHSRMLVPAVELPKLF